MEPLQIPLGLAKFQKCCRYGCEGDAIHETSAQKKDLVYYAGSCFREGHKEAVEGAMERLSARSKPERLADLKKLNIDNLFVSQAGSTTKHKYLQGAAHTQAAPAPPTPPAAPEVQETTEPDIEELRAPPNWRFIPNIKKWMAFNLKVIPVSKVNRDELICSCRALLEANYQRVPADLRWVEDLIPTAWRKFMYPRESLEVGTAAAREKLKEFQAELERRG